MATTPTKERTMNVRAEIDESTHRALKQEQSRRELETGQRPQMTEVVALVLTEWAQVQSPVAG